MDPNNFAPGVDELQKEITQLRLENEEYRRYASFPSENPTPVLEFDGRGEVVYLNPAAQEALSQLDIKDARRFLPEDYEKLTQGAAEKETPQVFRVVEINGRVFDENIYYSREYETLRIYATDITLYRKTEEALRKSRQELLRTQEFLETITKGTDVIIAAIDKYFNYTYFNQAYREEVKRLSGKDIQIGDNILDVFAHLPDQKKTVQDEWSQVLAGKSTNKILEFGAPSVLNRIYNVLHAPIWDADGNVVGAGEVAYNISENVMTQAALQESEIRFNMALKNSPVSVAAQDEELRYIWAYNHPAGKPEEIIGKTDNELYSPESAAWLTELKRKALSSGKELGEQGWVTIRGNRFYQEIFLDPIRDSKGHFTGIGITTVDLTNIKLTEQALRDSEERYRSLFEAMTEGFAIHEVIFDKDNRPCDYRFLDINPAFERLTGLKRELIVGKTYHEILPNEGDSWVNRYGNVVITGKPAQFEDYSPTLNRHYEVFAYPYSPDQFAVMFMDVTERKKIEDELRINLTKYSILFHSFPLGITVSDKNGNILESNEEAESLLDLPEEEHTHRQIDGREWRIIRPDGTPMPTDEFASVRALKEHKRIENLEMGIIKDGDQVTWLSVTAAPLPLEDFGVVITYNDITPRIEAEDALRKAHEELEFTIAERTEELRLQTKAVDSQRQRFNDVLEILPAYLILLTNDYHVAFANRYFRERFGEDKGRHCYEYLFGRSGPCENCETYRVLDTNKSHHWEWLGPDGRNYDVFDFPFPDVDGSNLILEMGIDITGRKQAEERLRLLNAYNRSLIEANLDALVTISPDGKIGDVNAVTEAITGYPREMLIGTEFYGYFTDPEKARLGYREVFETGMVRDYELEIQHKDGRMTPVVYNASLYRDETGEVAGVLAAARDISERKQVERQLVILNSALEAAANGIILADKDGTILWTNSAFSQMTGYSNDEIVGKNPRFLKSGKQDRKFYRRMWDTILAGKVWRGELINRRKDGTLYVEEQTITPVFDMKGDIINFISIRQDITEHKQAEEALKNSEEQYRSLVLATTQIVWQTNGDGDVIEDNPDWRAYTGQSVKEVMGKGWINALHPDDRQRTAEIWAHAVETKTAYDTEYRIRNLNGEYGYFSIRGVPIVSKEGNISGWIGTCTDITEKRNYENQLIQAEKHAAIGRMVGSVTHEINNPLQTIKNCLYLIQQDIDPSSPINEPLEMAYSETQRLSNIVGQLRQLYRPQASMMMNEHDLLELIEEVHSLITPHLNNSHVAWQPLSGMKNCKVSCVKDQITEVLLNICMNAIEAMQPDGGVLSIDMLCSQNNVGIIITDTGQGINPEIQPHIFEPFITTKEYGLGLGLSICYGIIQKHGGQITVNSQPGLGTSFTITLPIIG